MRDPLDPLHAALDDVWFDLAELCRLAGVTEPWVRQRLEDGLLKPADSPAREVSHFDVHDLRRAGAWPAWSATSMPCRSWRRW